MDKDLRVIETVVYLYTDSMPVGSNFVVARPQETKKQLGVWGAL